MPIGSPAASANPPPQVLHQFPRPIQHAALYTVRPPPRAVLPAAPRTAPPLPPPPRSYPASFRSHTSSFHSLLMDPAPPSLTRPKKLLIRPPPLPNSIGPAGPYALVPLSVPIARPRRNFYQRIFRFLLILLVVFPMPLIIILFWGFNTTLLPHLYPKPLRFLRSRYFFLVLYGAFNHYAMKIYYSRKHIDRDREIRRRIFWPPLHLAARLAHMEKTRPNGFISRWGRTWGGTYGIGLVGSAVNVVCSAGITLVVVLVFVAVLGKGGRTVSGLREMGWRGVDEKVRPVVEEVVEDVMSGAAWRVNEWVDEAKELGGRVGDLGGRVGEWKDGWVDGAREIGGKVGEWKDTWFIPTGPTTALATTVTTIAASVTTTAALLTPTNQPYIHRSALEARLVWPKPPSYNFNLPKRSQYSDPSSEAGTLPFPTNPPSRCHPFRKYKKLYRPPIFSRRRYKKPPKNKYDPGVWTIWYPYSHSARRRPYGVRRGWPLWKGTHWEPPVGPNGFGYDPSDRGGRRLGKRSARWLNVDGPLTGCNWVKDTRNRAKTWSGERLREVDGKGFVEEAEEMVSGGDVTEFITDTEELMENVTSTIIVPEMNLTNSTRIRYNTPTLNSTQLWINNEISEITVTMPTVNSTLQWQNVTIALLNVSIPVMNATGLLSEAEGIVKNVEERVVDVTTEILRPGSHESDRPRLPYADWRRC